MPPRKSNVSTVSNGAEEGGDATPAKAAKDGISVEDLSLPKSMVGRLAKGVLPANTSIQKDALLALHKSATVFVNYIASNANETTQAAGKKTIMPADVMAAMKDAEFEDFLPRLEAELKKYNETQCDKRNNYRRKVKEEKAAASGSRDGEAGKEAPSTAAATNGDASVHENVDDAERPFKKFKAQDGAAVNPIAVDDADETEENIDNQDDDAEDQQDDEMDEDEQPEDDAEEEGEDEAEDDDRDDIAAAAGLRDEALDDPGSDSD